MSGLQAISALEQLTTAYELLYRADELSLTNSREFDPIAARLCDYACGLPIDSPRMTTYSWEIGPNEILSALTRRLTVRPDTDELYWCAPGADHFRTVPWRFSYVFLRYTGLTACDITDFHAADLACRHIQVSTTLMENCHFARTEFKDCRVQGSTFATINFADSRLKECHFYSCTFTDVHFPALSDCFFTDCTFTNCVYDSVTNCKFYPPEYSECLGRSEKGESCLCDSIYMPVDPSVIPSYRDR